MITLRLLSIILALEWKQRVDWRIGVCSGILRPNVLQLMM